MVKAIETRYKGYRFRSRLEARWAVFFDAIGKEWEYEKEGYDLGEAGWYLPDFWIWEDKEKGTGYWVEIKPHKNVSAREFNVCFQLSKQVGGAMLIGTPELPRYTGPRGGQEPAKLFQQGYVPFTLNGAPMPEWDYYHGAWAMPFGEAAAGREKTDAHWWMAILRLECWHERSNGTIDLWPVPSFEPILLNEYGTGDPLAAKTKTIDSPRLRKAYEAARSARFEHGERGR